MFSLSPFSLFIFFFFLRVTTNFYYFVGERKHLCMYVYVKVICTVKWMPDERFWTLQMSHLETQLCDCNIMWYRIMFRKVYSGVSQTLIYKLSVGTEYALYLFSSAILRNLEVLGGIQWWRALHTSDVLWVSHKPF